MNRLVSHIEFLLHDHNCVIIPGFGGFVVNALHARTAGEGVLHAPTCELVFNRDLTYNDGLMAQSYMKTYQLSFDTATLEIEKGIRDLKHRLHDHRHVELGQLGSLTMHDDKRFVYSPATFTRPAFFGLSKTELKPLTELIPASEERSNVVPLKPDTRQRRARVASISAAAVAVIAVMLLIFPVSDATTGRQSARMLSEAEWFRPRSAASQHAANIANPPGYERGSREIPAATASGEEDTTLPAEANVFPEEVSNAPGVTEVTTVAGNEDAPRYYIVMGVFTNSETARKMTSELNQRGFTGVEWLERPGRIDVYAASFTDEAAARIYLREVHGQYPTYSDAWILKR